MATLTPRLETSPEIAPSLAHGEWVPWVVLAGVVAVLGPAEAVTTRSFGTSGLGHYLAVTLLLAGAVGLSRRWPGLALGLVWLVGGFHMATGIRPLVTELVVVVVAFATARWGGLGTVWLAGLSIPMAAVIGVVFMGSGFILLSANAASSRLFPAAAAGLNRPEIWGAVSGVAILGIPWTVGLAMRSWDRARASRVSLGLAEADVASAQRESEQAREIARLREGQARLAHDVHDVVGHSLAVILAQAESAQYLRDDDPAALKATMATIADSARSSLQDVRQVLSATQQTATQQTAARAADLDRLVEGVRSSGREIIDSEVGAPRPLPPELAAVAYRVLQEMLTNAVRHGRPDRPVHVERHWPDGSWEGDLRIEVRNAEQARAAPVPEVPEVAEVAEQGGQGIEGMRRRLESVGGRLDVRRRSEGPDPTFTVTAWVPVRSSGA